MFQILRPCFGVYIAFIWPCIFFGIALRLCVLLLFAFSIRLSISLIIFRVFPVTIFLWCIGFFKGLCIF